MSENTKMKFCPELFDAMSNAWHSGRDGDVGAFMEITKKAMIDASEENAVPTGPGPIKTWPCLYAPSDKIFIIKEIRNVLGIGLAEAKHMADVHQIKSTAEQYAEIMSRYFTNYPGPKNLLTGA